MQMSTDAFTDKSQPWQVTTRLGRGDVNRESTVSKLTEANLGQTRGKHGDALWVSLKSNEQAACRRKERRDDRKPQR
jgi:hypothetical protein